MSNDVAVQIIEKSRFGKIDGPKFYDADQRNGFSEIDRGDKDVSASKSSNFFLTEDSL